jgi:hypothetical protein
MSNEHYSALVMRSICALLSYPDVRYRHSNILPRYSRLIVLKHARRMKLCERDFCKRTSILYNFGSFKFFKRALSSLVVVSGNATAREDALEVLEKAWLPNTSDIDLDREFGVFDGLRENPLVMGDLQGVTANVHCVSMSVLGILDVEKSGIDLVVLSTLFTNMRSKIAEGVPIRDNP